MTTLLNVQRTLLQLYSGREQVQQYIKKKKNYIENWGNCEIR